MNSLSYSYRMNPEAISGNVPTQSFSPDSFQTFGDLLKYLRRRERLTQLEFSIAVGYSDAQITRLEKNQRRPDITALKALFIPALHIENEPDLIARFLELAQSAQQEDAPAPGFAPYKGLLFFEEVDSDLFFGRESLTAHLAERVSDLVTDSDSRFLAVVGASGSGKSSLVRAGLAVALKRGGWVTRVFTPTVDPLRMLEANLSPVRAKDAERILILVDQFEEVFTLCRDEMERIAFIEKLLAAAKERSKKTTIVIALRADFYSHCAQYPLLRRAVAAEQEYIGQMTSEELRRAIEEPAKRGGWEFEPGLVDTLLNDIGAQGTSEPEPGALPLLSHALLATWERRRGRTFTLEGYHASGGVRGAIAETAESVFTDQLNQTQQEIARDVFLRLTELGEGTEDTRRRAALNELVRQSAEATQLRAVLNTLAEARLITLNADSAEVAHEALIREWQRLHEWLTQDREGLLLHRHLTESAHEWEAREHDPAELYRGARLAQAREWASANEERLNASERAFLAASIDQEQHDVFEREAQRQRELESAQKLAETERRSVANLRIRNRVITVIGSVAIALAVLASIFGFQSRSNLTAAQVANTQSVANASTAQAEAQNRATAEANAVNERNTAQQQSLLASVRELAGAANLNLEVDPERSILLALQSVALTDKTGQPPLIEAQDALHRAVQASRVQFTLRGHTVEVMGLAYSPDGKLLATIAEDSSIIIWDTASGTSVINVPSGELFQNVPRSVSFSPDGTRLAGGYSNNQAKVWEVATGKELLVLEGHTDLVIGVTFSPDGKWIATASWDQITKVWDANTGQEVLTLDGQNDLVNDVAFSPDGKYLATAGRSFGTIIWDATTGKEILTLSVLGGTSSAVFSPDGETLATANGDATWNLWDVSTGQKLTTGFGHASLLTHISFDPRGGRVATTGEDGTARVWDAVSGRELLTLSGHSSGVESVAFSPDGIHLATASRDTTVKIWDISPAGGGEWFNLVGHTDSVWWVTYSSDGKYIATAGLEGDTKLWDAETGKEIYTFHSFENGVWDVSFSPDSKRLVATGDRNEQIAKIYDITTGKELLTIPTTGERMVFSPDGLYLATSSVNWDNFQEPILVKILDANTGEELFTLNGELKNTTQDIKFSRDGKLLVTAGEDGVVKVWDVKANKEVLSIDVGIRQVGAAFSPDGRLLASAGNDALVHIWDAGTDKELQTLGGHTGPIFFVDFSPDGRFLASSSVDRTVKIWSVADNFTTQPLTLYGHSQGIFRLAFSPDGTRLVTASRDTTARVYALSMQDLIEIAQSRLTRSLTPHECNQYLHVDICPPER